MAGRIQYPPAKSDNEHSVRNGRISSRTAKMDRFEVEEIQDAFSRRQSFRQLDVSIDFQLPAVKSSPEGKGVVRGYGE